jgi:hypothetical protein
MGRPLGSRNRVTAGVRAVVARLEKAGSINLTRAFIALQGIVEDADAPAVARIAAARELFNRAYGLPKAHLDVEHGISRDAVSLLIEIGQSDRHRQALEALEREREKRRALTTTLEE